MTTNIIPINQAKMPAAMRARLEAGTAVNRNFADGVRDAFPLISIRGGKFRVRVEGEERSLVDHNEQPLPLNVVLVNGSKEISKVYYANPYQTNDMNPPDCWSLDGVRPDASIPQPINPICGTCDFNKFGSAEPRGEGKRGGKRCQDARRIAIVMPDFLGRVVEGRMVEPMVFLMRVPATSLKNLKDYAVNLERNGWEPTACITQIYFDSETEYPKLKFRFINALDDAKYAQASQIAESKLVRDMLKAPDFDTTVSNDPMIDPHNIPQRSSVQGQAQPQQQAPDPGASIAEELFNKAARQKQEEVPARETKPAQTQAQDTIIDLPTGERFNTATGEFLPAGQPKVEMPSFDPATIALPDGRFYHQPSGKFVVGPEVGAPEVGKAPNEPPKRVRAKPKPKDTPPAGEQAAPQEVVATAEAPEAAQQQASPPVAANGNGKDAEHTVPAILPATAALSEIMESVLPKGSRKS